MTKLKEISSAFFKPRNLRGMAAGIAVIGGICGLGSAADTFGERLYGDFAAAAPRANGASTISFTTDGAKASGALFQGVAIDGEKVQPGTTCWIGHLNVKNLPPLVGAAYAIDDYRNRQRNPRFVVWADGKGHQGCVQP